MTYEYDDTSNPPEFGAPVEQDWNEYEPAIAPGWPKGIGITSIVLGSLGLTCGGFNIVGSVFSEKFLEMAAQGQDWEFSPMTQVGPLDYANLGLTIVGSLVLLIAGIMTTMRSLNGRYLHLFYAVLKFALMAFGIWLFLDKRTAHLQWAETQPADNPFAAPGQATQALVGAAIGLAIGSIWPLFCLIWFGFVKTSREDFTGGADAPL